MGKRNIRNIPELSGVGTGNGIRHCKLCGKPGHTKRTCLNKDKPFVLEVLPVTIENLGCPSWKRIVARTSQAVVARDELIAGVDMGALDHLPVMIYTNGAPKVHPKKVKNGSEPNVSAPADQPFMEKMAAAPAPFYDSIGPGKDA